MISLGMLRKGSVDLWYLASSTDIEIIVGKQIGNHWQVSDL